MTHYTHDFIHLNTADPTLIIEAAYATADTFLGAAVYPENSLYLMKPAAERLMRVQSRLREQGLSLKIWDAYRPLSLQKVMWDLVRDDRYIANPQTGSRHNRGCAVDCTLADREGCELRMPTAYDDFSERAHRDFMDLPEEAIRHRRMLEDVMKSEGFLPLHEEWWHFDAPEWERYPVLDINPYERSYQNLAP